MPSYLILGRWTDQGVKNIKDTVKRAQTATEAAEKLGGRVSIYWTQGKYDMAVSAEFPDEDALNAVSLGTVTRGSVRTETHRAYTAQEMQRIIDKLS